MTDSTTYAVCLYELRDGDWQIAAIVETHHDPQTAREEAKRLNATLPDGGITRSYSVAKVIDL